MLAAARAGRSEVLVLRGAPGVGKSALLGHLGDQAVDCRVLRTAGVESEIELAYAGLHQLCAPILDRIERLPAPQHDALRTAFGLLDGDRPDVFLVGLAVLGLLSETAEERPLVCLVDDAQWLDRASAHTLAFVARRVLADSIALVFARREPSTTTELDGLPSLLVEGLHPDDAHALLDASGAGRLDAQVRARIVAETRGNPLALLELTRGRSPAELAGGFAVPTTGSLTGRIERSIEDRLESLPPDGRTLVRLAAAEPVGDVPLLWRAARRLDIDAEAGAVVEAGDLMEIGPVVRFSHPLVRSVAYRSAPPEERRRLHGALAAATDPDRDPDRRAWHLAQATVEPDEAVAALLERAAATARARGGAAAAYAFLALATELTPDPATRGARALDAAGAALDAAAPANAAELVTAAELSPLDAVQRATAIQIRARVAFAERRGSDAPPLLLDAALRLEPLDPDRARAAHLEALGAAIFAGRLAGSVGLGEVAEAARQAPRPTGPPTVVDLLVDGLATRFADGYGPAIAPLRQALDHLQAGVEPGRDLRWMWMGCRIAAELWDDDAIDELSDRQLRHARETGALDVLPMAIVYRAGAHVHAGDLAAAAQLAEESELLTASVGGANLLYAAIVLAGWRGDEGPAHRLIRIGVDDATARGEGRGLAWTDYALAVLHNGLEQHPAAMAAAQRAADGDDLGIGGWALFELVEAAVRAGRRDVAVAALARLVERTQATATAWGRGVEARSRALVEHGPAEAAYREALEHLATTHVTVHLARTHLVFGEWLRGEDRRTDAREQLRTAHEMFTDVGARGFAERARRELAATGETVARAASGRGDGLTAQEAQIARLAMEGRTNPEIAGQLYISPRTVEYHLHKVFSKLGIASRRELRDVL